MARMLFWRNVPPVQSEHAKVLEARSLAVEKELGRDKFDDDKFKFFAIKLRIPKG